MFFKYLHNIICDSNLPSYEILLLNMILLNNNIGLEIAWWNRFKPENGVFLDLTTYRGLQNLVRFKNSSFGKHKRNTIDVVIMISTYFWRESIDKTNI